MSFIEQLQPEWQPMSVLDHLKGLTMCNKEGVDFVLNGCGSIYLDIRLDMRTGSVLINNQAFYLVWENNEDE